MAIHIVPIVKALAPLIVNASGIVANLKRVQASSSSEDKLNQLQREAIETGELLAALAKQIKAVAQQLSIQAEINERCHNRLKLAVALAILSALLSAIALGVVLFP